jgi:hypothetical protein
MANMDNPQLSHRAIAMLRATAAGRAELTCSCEPDLRVDSLPCCDQATARFLFHSGLVQRAAGGTIGQWMTARLTPAGEKALALADTARHRDPVLAAA